MSTTQQTTATVRPPGGPLNGCEPVIDSDLVELVDAVAAAVDTDRSWEVERVGAAFDALGVAHLFTSELRLNGSPSAATCPCHAEGWL
jgi:hypothetical protein